MTHLFNTPKITNGGEKMPKNIRHQLRSELYLQRKKGRRTSRNAIKQNKNGKFSDYHHITSDKSLKTHLERINKFAEFCSENGIKKINEITPNFAQKYLIHERNFGKSAATIGADALAINHALIGSHYWKESQRLQKSKIIGMPKRSMKISTQREKHLTSAEWRRQYPHKYQIYKNQIDTIRAFGFRRRELTGGTSYHGRDGLGNKTLYKFNDGSLRAITIGKGGKVRWTECRKDLQPEMEKIYKDIIHDEDYKPKSKADFIHNLKTNQPIYKPFSHEVPSHIFRADYAQNKLQELAKKTYKGQQPYTYYKHAGKTSNGRNKFIKKTGYHNLANSYQIGEFKATYGAFYELSNFLGHNRLDVLSAYLGEGR